MAIRWDSWRSTLTGLGGSRDKRNSYDFVDAAPLDWARAEALFNGNDLAQKICASFPDEALREPVRLEVEAATANTDTATDQNAADDSANTDDAVELGAELCERMEELEAQSAINEAAVWAAVFGDAKVFMLAEDGREMIEPLDVKRVRAVHALRVVDRRDLVVAQWYEDPLDPKFDTPMTFRFQGGRGVEVAPTEEIHETRFLHFYGARTSRRKVRELGGWHFSRLHACQVPLRDFGISWEGAAYLLQDASQAVFKLKDLLAVLASDNGLEDLEKRMEAIEMARSIARAMIIDADTEDFAKVATSFTGVPDMLDRFAARLAAAAQMPVTKLMGTQPTGLQATGDADQTTWNNDVATYQTKTLKPQFVKLAAVLAAEQGISQDRRIKVCFPPLDRPTPLQTAQLRKAVADADAIYVTAQVLQPEEVALNRFRPDGWSPETKIDPAVRKAIQEQNEADGNVGAGVVADKEAKAHEQAKELAAAKPAPNAPPAAAE